ncbi:phosphopantetheine-binding protein, partial [Mycolicibacterium palauense]|uniref:phosphopantetheine-binding protein n=1 Tax=Mycolicibacterium palauense TaxID=2034511 RepID=UPI001FE4F567
MGEPASGPQTVREEVAELLGVDAQTLAADADLLAEGLDSLRIMTLSGRWRKRGIDVDFAALVANPTVRAWRTLIEGRPAAPDAPAPEPATPDGAASHDHDGQPFALAPMQHAMWVGRNDDQQLGGVAGHLYVEFDGAGVSAPRLREAAAALSARHPMLRVEFLPDGTQRIGARVLDVTVEDLRDLDDDAAGAALLRTRETRSHQLLDGEVLQLALSLLPGGRTRLHVDLDMQAADAVSYRTLMSDLARLYRGATLPELTYSYRRYRAAVEESPRHAPRAADVSWWRERLSELPGPPALPTVPPAEQPDPRRSTRHWHW